MARADFHRECVEQAAAATGKSFRRRSTSVYESDDGGRLVCLVSTQHGKSSSPAYWFGFKAEQESVLDDAAGEAWVVLGMRLSGEHPSGAMVGIPIVAACDVEGQERRLLARQCRRQGRAVRDPRYRRAARGGTRWPPHLVRSRTCPIPAIRRSRAKHGCRLQSVR